MPANIRRLAGLRPDTAVEYEFRDVEVILHRAGGKTRGRLLVERLEGAFTEAGLSAAEIMRETRGED